MAQIKFSSVLIDLLRRGLEEALAEVARKHHLMPIKLGIIKYTPDSFRVEVQGTIEGGESREVQLYKAYAPVLGLPEFGSVIKIGKKEMVIIGLRVGGPYKHILLRGLDDDKPYKIDVKKYKRGV